MPRHEAKPLMKSLPEVKINENLPKKTESKIYFEKIGLLETPKCYLSCKIDTYSFQKGFDFILIRKHISIGKSEVTQANYYL